LTGKDRSQTAPLPIKCLKDSITPEFCTTYVNSRDTTAYCSVRYPPYIQCLDLSCSRMNYM